MTRFDIIPARLETATRRIETRAPVTVLQATQPERVTESRRAMIRPPETRWVRDSLTGEITLSSGERADIEANGLSLADVTPGQCVHEFHVPAVLGQRRHRVLVREADTRYRITEARLRQRAETITLVPRHRRLIEVPPVIRDTESRLRVHFTESATTLAAGGSPVAYRVVSQPTVVTPAMLTEVVEPAKTMKVPLWLVDVPATATPLPGKARFETVTEDYTQVAPRFLWRIGGSPAARHEAVSLAAAHASGDLAAGHEPLPPTARATGRIACRRQMPAVDHRYAFTHTARPAEVRSRVEPARFQDVVVERQQAAAQAVPRLVPAQTATHRVTVDLPPERTVSVPVVCAAAVDRSLIRDVQAALHQAGFDPGVVDGLAGPATLAALAGYETARGLGVTGNFAVRTLQQLGVRAAAAVSD